MLHPPSPCLSPSMVDLSASSATSWELSAQNGLLQEGGEQGVGGVGKPAGANGSTDQHACHRPHSEPTACRCTHQPEMLSSVLVLPARISMVSPLSAV